MDRTGPPVGGVVLLALLAGCSAGGGGGGGGSGTANWCGSGTIDAIASQQAGGSMTVESQGTTERDGREVCQISYEVDGEANGEYARMDVFFSEGQEYVEFVYYDADGNVVGEMNYSGTGGSDAGDTGGDTGGDADENAGDGAPSGESAEWCRAGQTTSTSNPQQGTRTTFTVEGLVEHDGRTVCKSTFEFQDEDAQFSRIEMYYDEDQSYQTLVYYDQNGDVVYEIDASDGS
jgi:hypothetical protein